MYRGQRTNSLIKTWEIQETELNPLIVFCTDVENTQNSINTTSDFYLELLDRSGSYPHRASVCAAFQSNQVEAMSDLLKTKFGWNQV